MQDNNAVPLIVHSAGRDQVDGLNGLLRQTGMAAHCTWIPAIGDIADALEQINPEVLICCTDKAADVKALAAIRDQVANTVPIIVVHEHIDETLIARDMACGAADSVSLQQPQRLQAVIARELHSFRLERTLNFTLRASQDYRSQLEAVLQRSNDAIAQVQEGILVNANAAWLELFALADSSEAVGQPIMDLFDESSRAPLTAALTACQQGKWQDHTLKVHALLRDGSVVPFDLALTIGEFEGEPSVRLIVPVRKRDDHELARDMEAAVQRDTGTGLLTRRHLLAALKERLEKPVLGGVRYVACVRPDKFLSIEQDVGVVASETFLVTFSNILRSLLGPHDIAGRFGGNRFVLLLERGSIRDVEAWSENLIGQVSRHTFQIENKNLHATCSIGLSVIPREKADLNAAILDTLEGVRRARSRGGNQSVVLDRSDADTRVQAYDEIWVRHIKAALMENRFRLVQQPLAALTGAEQKMFDIAVRMLDPQGKDVLPSEFLPAAARNRLGRSIDRWVLGASMSLAARRQQDLLFVRLSNETALDSQLPKWLELQQSTTRVEPHRLCVQVSQETAAANLPQITQLATDLRALGFRFALSHFGVGRGSDSLLANVPLDFIKIDGALMQGLASNSELQQQVRAMVGAANEHNIQTIAEQIEDANTMAVVWQLGVQYIQGYLVHAPEEVVLQS